jgi:cardiolipin synthase
VRAVRALADQAFSRAAGAPLVAGNAVRLLRDARENYPAWLEAIASARQHVYFENYIVREDEAGARFAEALIERARAGVRVRLVYDWLGSAGKTSLAFWERLRAGGVEVRCYNPPRLSSPLGWLSRDHRKLVSVDGRVGFVTGLCVGREWIGEPERRVEPWRDTGVEIRGPAVAELERAFAQIWAMLGAPLPAQELGGTGPAVPAGGVSVRIVATLPAMASVFRFDQLVAALARERVWLTDAYYAGTSLYVESLTAAAREGVDVRLLVPSSSDIPAIRPLARAGYRALLQAGVRVFEWNGSMLHAKTAVADGRWSRVGSTNLNLASWLGNCEIDAVIEDTAFAHELEEMYVADLASSTELVLDASTRVRPIDPRPPAPGARPRRRGSGSRAAAGAVRIGNALGAAFADRRVLEPVEARMLLVGGGALLGLAALFAVFPLLLALPLIAALAWGALALIYRGVSLRVRRGGAGPPQRGAPREP